MPASFFDTNVLLYIASGDAAKADRAEAVAAAGGAISGITVPNYGTGPLNRSTRRGIPELNALAP